MPKLQSMLAIVLVVCRRDDGTFLVVHERDGWYLPAGRVEPGESLIDAAIRETREEAGIDVVLSGVLRVEYNPRGVPTRLRALFMARPADDRAPKSVADEESLGAAWLSLDQIRGLPLRGGEVIDVFESVARGSVVHPLSVLTDEGADWP